MEETLDLTFDQVANTHWNYAHLCRECRKLDLNSLAEATSYDSTPQPFYVEGPIQCPLCFFFLACAKGADHVWLKNPKQFRGIYLLLEHICLSAKPPKRVILVSDPCRVGDNGHTGSPIAAEQVGGCGNSMVALRRMSTDRISIEPIKNWLSYCKQHHPSCSGNPSKIRSWSFELWVIDCESRALVTAPENEFVYVALSYVWGSESVMPGPLALEKGVQGLGSNVLDKNIPKSIEDAIEVVLALGFRYLWVDKYCIDQSKQEHVHEQLSVMDQIYDSAQLTIIAGTGTASTGLPGISSTPRIAQPIITIGSMTWISGMHDPETEIKKSPWFSRGWTYQEGLCSRRRLIFTSEQVVFECNEMVTCESQRFDPEGSQIYPSKLHLTSSGIHGIFKGGLNTLPKSLISHIETYTERSLTYQSDALRAIQGICNIFANQRVPILNHWGIPTYFDCYRADGVWIVRSAMVGSREAPSNDLSALCYGLLWNLTLDGGVRRAGAKRRVGFPSWSWAGWVAPIEWDRVHMPMPNTSLAKIKQMRQDLVEDSNSINPVDPGTDTLAASRQNQILIIDTEVVEVKLTKRFEAEVRLTTNELVTWSVTVTPAGTHDTLWRKLPNGNVDCVLLDHDNNEYGLVVWGDHEVKERLGVIRLRAYNPNGGSYQLRDYFPSSRREVLLC